MSISLHKSDIQQQKNYRNSFIDSKDIIATYYLFLNTT
jgi:hypothetical protein